MSKLRFFYKATFAFLVPSRLPNFFGVALSAITQNLSGTGVDPRPASCRVSTYEWHAEKCVLRTTGRDRRNQDMKVGQRVIDQDIQPGQRVLDQDVDIQALLAQMDEITRFSLLATPFTYLFWRRLATHFDFPTFVGVAINLETCSLFWRRLATSMRIGRAFLA